eukprot:scaffold328_cov130-Cylindrotheca_fusiformis.AAC.18
MSQFFRLSQKMWMQSVIDALMAVVEPPTTWACCVVMEALLTVVAGATKRSARYKTIDPMLKTRLASDLGARLSSALIRTFLICNFA